MEQLEQRPEEIKRKIIWFAVSSRIFVLALSFISNLVIPDHKATDVYINHNYALSEGANFTDYLIHLVFGGLVRWDSHYFLYISQYGYTKENTLAFFPLFPMAVQLTAGFFGLVVNTIGFPVVSYASMLLLSAVFINFVFFILAAVTLYDLSVKVLGDARAAYYAAISFCVNPASIFFSAPYSESLYCFLVFPFMEHLFHDRFMVASLIIGLSCATRSNGVLNVGFIVYRFIIFLKKGERPIPIILIGNILS